MKPYIRLIAMIPKFAHGFCKISSIGAARIGIWADGVTCFTYHFMVDLSKIENGSTLGTQRVKKSNVYETTIIISMTLHDIVVCNCEKYFSLK